MHEAFNKLIDQLIESGMDEYEAIALVTQVMEEEAKDFVLFDYLFNSDKVDLNKKSIS